MLRHLQKMGKRATAGGWNPGFLTDPNCVALWRFEPDFLLIDSTENENDLLPDYGGGSEDTVNFKEGSGSTFVDEAGTHNQKFYITDGNLSDNFPAKNGTTNRTFSICFWFKPTIWGTAYPLYKGNLRIAGYYTPNADYRRIALYVGGYFIHDSWLLVNNWYHIGITFDGNNGPNYAYRIRIYSDTAGEIVGTDKTGTTTNLLNISADTLQIGKQVTGNLDEFAIFNNKIITPDQFDQIVGGTYGI